MRKRQNIPGSPRAGYGVLLLLAGTMVPLLGSALSALLAPAAVGAVSLAGYLLTMLGGVLLLPDNIWFATVILCAVLGGVTDNLPLFYDTISGETLYVATAVVSALCYAAVYLGLNSLLARRNIPAGERGLGLRWVLLFAASEALMFLSLYTLPRMHAPDWVQLLATVGAFACAVCALVFQVRYLLLARRRLG